ncbi:hypothetical protein LTR95_006393 [Oleoguttula sp. CCFEE 5521]
MSSYAISIVTSSRSQRSSRSNSYDSTSSRRSSTSTSPSHTPTALSSYTGSRRPQAAMTELSTTSVQTMGSPDRPGYVRGQAPADYFHDDNARRAWDASVRARSQRAIEYPSTSVYSTQRSGTSSHSSWRERPDAELAPSDSISNIYAEE